MKPFEQQTYYELLEISASAPETEIRAAYARAIETYSPDSVAVYALVDPGQVDALRARLTEAMEILTDSDLRAEYDRMIGVSRAEAGVVVSMGPALAAAAQAVQPEAPPPAQAKLESAAPAAPAPSEAPVPEAKATPEPAPAREAPAEAAAAAPAPAAAPAEQTMAPVTPSQIHTAFRSYAISYVQSTPIPAAPSAPAVPEPVQPAAAQAPEEAPRPPEPAPEPVAAAPAAPAPVAASAPAEENEISGARAPALSAEEAQAAVAKPESSPPPARTGRPGRTFSTPPPLAPGGRRISRSTPTVQPGGSAARSQQGASMNLEEAQQIAQESAIATAEAALAQVAAKAREPKPKPIELPPSTEFNGELLRRVRESRNLTLAQLAERTRISAKHLENVEADRYTALPATVYLRGILMNIARELNLDPLRVSRSYLALAAEPKKK